MVALNLRDNRIGGSRDKRGVKALKEMLKTDRALRHLDLSSNLLTKADVTILADGVRDNRAMTKLNLSDNLLYAAAGKILALKLKKNTVLQDLDLSDNGIGMKSRVIGHGADARGIIALCDALLTKEGFTCLNFRNNGGIGDQELRPQRAAGLARLVPRIVAQIVAPLGGHNTPSIVVNSSGKNWFRDLHAFQMALGLRSRVSAARASSTADEDLQRKKRKVAAAGAAWRRLPRPLPKAVLHHVLLWL